MINKKRGRLEILFFVIILSLIIVYADTFSDINQGDFNGIYINTSYNLSGFIQLNASIIGNSSFIIDNGTEMIGNENGLISYWRFNESSWNGTQGNVKDVLGKNNGTNFNGADTTEGMLGRAGNFDGLNNKVQIANKEELNPGNGNFTITGWAKSYEGTVGTAGYQLYVAKRVSGTNGYYIGFQQGQGLNFIMGGTNRYDAGVGTPASILNSSYVNISYDTWFHFAGVLDRNSGKIYLYRDGVLVASTNIPSLGIVNNTGNLTIGYDEEQSASPQNGYPVNGSIDEVALWNRALNSSEILALYNQGKQNITTNNTPTINFTSGTYESPVIDVGNMVQWKNISWNGLQIANLNTIENLSNSVLLAQFEESSGKIIDSSSYSNNGTNYGAAYNISGKVGNAMSFDGINDYIDFGNPTQLQITGNIAISAWIKFNQIPSGTKVMAIINKNEAGGYGIIANEQVAGGIGKLVTYFHINGAYKNVGMNLTNLSANTWYHILAVYNGTSVDFYLNGEKKDSATATGSISNIAYNLTIGANPGPTYNEFFNGTIDEVYIFNRSLNSSEIASLSRNSTGSSVEGLRFKLRTSNDNTSWSSYMGSDGTSNSYYDSVGNLNLSNSKYIQYKTYINNSNTKFYNISISYENIENLTVSLDSPADNYLTNEYNINITCSASSVTQLKNITPYYNKFGWDASEPAKSISGTSNTTIFTLNEITSSTLWNCYVCDINGDCAFANSNKTIIGDVFVPTISLVSPAQGYIENLSSSLNFVFNANDNRATSLNCILLINNLEVASNSSVIPGFNTVITSVLSNGDYSWKINCSDGLNSDLSEERNLKVNISSAYTPFWAKANTHTHTTYSDGTSTLETVLNTYKNLGYNIIAITDHSKVHPNCSINTNLSANFICINSEEWTTPKHITRINVSSAVGGTNAQIAVNTANAEGGFAIVAHPSWSSTIWTVSELTTLENYTAMEIYNHVIERLTPDPYAIDKWDSVLKLGKKIFGVASDDMHVISTDLGFGWTKVYLPSFTKEDYINSMKTGYFYSSQGPNMDSGPFNLICDEATIHHMGETTNCSAVRINATISATNSSFIMKNISLIKDGEILNITFCSMQNCTLFYSENVSSSGYYRLQAQDSNNKFVWSNPIWVNKIATPVVITVNSPENNSNTNDYTSLINISLNQQTTLWYNLNAGSNITLCNNCTNYIGYSKLAEGENILNFYANNSDNIIKESKIYINLDFNKSFYENFSDNASIESVNNVVWSNNKLSLDKGILFGNVIIKSIITTNNITSFYIEFLDNNTENARGDGQRIPIILKYRFGSDSWTSIYNGDYIYNGTTVEGFNSNNLSLMFDFEKNNNTPIDLLNFKLTWKEFTVPLITNISIGSVTSNSAIISWNTDLNSNSSVLYGTSSSLGKAIYLNSSTSAHSVTLTGLNPSTGYFYKVVSCTEAKCSEEPQTPYPPYSFTTQAVSNSETPSYGGGSSGGGGGSIIISNTTKNNVEFLGLQNLIVKPGESRKLSLSLKNIGKSFINSCKIVGTNSSWITNSADTKDIGPGQIVDYILTLNVPNEIKSGIYDLEIALKCLDFNQPKIFSAEVIEQKLVVDLMSTKREKKDEVIIAYSVKDFSGINQNLIVEITLRGISNEKVAEISETRSIKASSENNFETLLKISPDLSGNFELMINVKSDIASSNIQETIVLGAPSKIGGLVILSGEENKDIYLSVFLIILLFIFALFSIKRIIVYKRSINRKPTIHALKKALDIS